jgi:quercetin dioxygenase-like cupin family protein
MPNLQLLAKNEGVSFMISMAHSPQEGKFAWLGGLGVEMKISSQQTGGVFSLIECTLEPGRLVPPHVHTREDEYTYVLEGEIGLRIGDQIIEATAGCTVAKPRGIPHMFWNAGPQKATAESGKVEPSDSRLKSIRLASIWLKTSALRCRTLDPIAPGGFDTNVRSYGHF